MTGNFHKWAGIGLFCAAVFVCRPGVAQEARITRQIDANEKVVLVQGIHPRARAGVDEGKVADEYALHGMVLEFGRTAQQQAALIQLLAAQQDRTSAEYHHWLTPEQFGERFGAAPADTTAIQQWLEKEGFHVDEIARGRTYIRFSGTAGQVRKSFSAEIHSFSVKGVKHFAPASGVSIPSALAPLVREVRNLDSFHLQAPKRKVQPVYYVGANGGFIAPGDMAAIYDFQSLRNQGYDGTGQSIVVVGQTDVSLSDLAVYRSSFGLPAAHVTIVTAGQNPGVSPDDVIESDLDLDVVSAVAPNATIVFVNAVSVIDSVQYAIDNNLAPVISMSYAGCEPLISADPVATAGVLQSWAQQANSEGITWIAASGDSGAAACDPFGYDAPYATYGLAVNLPASIPEVTGIGGTEFQSQTQDYWAVTTGANGGTAISYVPEQAWNGGFPNEPAGSGGGASVDFAKPIWQVGAGVPPDGARDVPDVALLAVNFVIAENGELSFFDASFNGRGVDGTSGSTPLFAGIVTLLNQYLSPFQPAQPGQGNINPTLYSIAQSNPDAFHDIVLGDNLWHCSGGLGCLGSGELGYLAGSGYDQVTGLGSIDAFNLVHQWPTIVGSAPTVSTGLASVTFPPGTAATLAGDVNANGSDTHTYFIYGTSSSLAGASQTPSVDLGTGATPSAFNASVAGLTANTTYYFQLVASNAAGTASGSIVSFTTDPGGQLPVVTTLSSSGVTTTSATLSGSVIPNGSDTHYWFAYGTEPTATSTSQTATVDAGSGSDLVSASASIGGLIPNQFYFFQLQASNSAGTTSGSTMVFYTSSAGQPPAASTGLASAITSNSASLGGTVNPNGLYTLYWFVFGVAGASANEQPQPLKYYAGSGSQPVSVSVPLSGLAPNTPYTFQIVASNNSGTNAGNVGTFTTNASGQATSVTTGTASNISSSTVTISGTINPNGKSTQYWFVYGESPTLNFAVKTSTLAAGSGSTAVPVSANLAGLQPGTYYYQLQTSGSGGSITGSILSFVVPGPPAVVTLRAGEGSAGYALYGQVNPNNADTQYWFLYGTSPTLDGAAKTTQMDAGAYLANDSIYAQIPSGVTPGTTYYFQLQASNQWGTSSGRILSFVQNLPVAITSPAVFGTTPGTSDLGEWTIFGSADPNGLDTHAWFVYSTSPILSGAIQTFQYLVNYQGAYSSTLTGLMTNTTYYFQAVASNAAGTVKGAILSFKTASGPAQPSLTLNPASNLTGTSATLTGTVNPNSLNTTYAMIYGTNSAGANGNFVTAGRAGSGTTPVPVGGTVTGLVPGTTYYYQLSASNSAPEGSWSQILSFTEPLGCFSSVTNGSSIFLPPDALAYSVEINGSVSGCGGSATSDQPWLTLTNGSSSGSWTLNYAVTLNNTGAARTAHITVGSQQFTITQDFTDAEFADVPPSATFFDAANLMFEAGVTTGCVPSNDPTTRSFCPNDSVTRQEMAAFIVRAVTGATTPITYNPTPYFTDVPATNPFFPHIQKMMDLGITNGCGTGLFCPTETIPRWEMAIFMIRARLALYGASFTTATAPYFTDVPTNVEGNGQPFPFIQRAYEEHITNGCGTNPLTYCPDELVTRGQMASFIMRGLFNETTILGPTVAPADGCKSEHHGGDERYSDHGYDHRPSTQTSK